MRHPLITNQRGVAIMIALFSIMIMTFIAVEISYETSVEYVVTNSEYHKVRSYYAAKSGIELGLLRVQLFRNVTSQFGETLKNNMEMVNKVWSFPFVWPPVIPTDLSSVERDSINESVTESLMNASYDVRIESEGSKIDINDLNSPSKALREGVKKSITQMIQNRLDQDDEWAEENENLDIEELLNNITDWIDEDDRSINGGDERSKYDQWDSDYIPPNRPFKTFDELRMVDGMTDEIFKILLPNITVFGSKGVSVNQAPKDVLKSIHSTFTDEIVDEIVTRIQDPNEGPFGSLEEFKGFLGNKVNWQEIEQSGIPLYFGSEYNFRITSIGSYSKSQSKIIAIVYDFDTVKDRLKEFLEKEEGLVPEDKKSTGSTDTSGTQQQDGAKQDPKKPPLAGKPRIVYWHEE